ncbi:MAG: SDR family NAD(P)-dependent oxidoreductase [Candidatus Nanopelagicales bacterium]
MSCALVTGASSGLGKEIALALAKIGYKLILVSSNKQKLKDLQLVIDGLYPSVCEVIQADLTKENDLKLVIDRIRQTSSHIDILVNCAGYMLKSDFRSTSLEQEINQLELLVKAPLVLTHTALSEMIKRRNGFVLNVCSIRALLRGSSYDAARNYLFVLSEALHEKYSEFGINVSVLTSGRLQQSDEKIQHESFWHFLLYEKVDKVAKLALRGMFSGKNIIVPSFQNKVLLYLLRILPMKLIRRYSNSI